ncbi:MAG: [FeFe] hydrogenase H-cluster radical SAM maturase HydG [Bacillota bacterium]
MTDYQVDFIKEEKINGILAQAGRTPFSLQVEVLEKACLAKGLSPFEAAVLLGVEDEDMLSEMFRVAALVKEQIYGKRVVLFAPLYLSNYCVNNCRYCGYRRDNSFPRRKLSLEEIREEVKILESMGHKRLTLECGEDPKNCPIDYVLEALATIYAVKETNGSIRRINVNIAATTVEEYRLLKEAGIGTYILFQETYHAPTYAYMHPSGPKSDFWWHTTAMHRAMEAGLDDVGFGVLYGLYDYRYETVAMLMHSLELERVFGVGPHTLSVPRLKPASGVEIDGFSYRVGDREFKKLVAVLRLALPYTGIILSTRERADLRQELLAAGVSQISAGSCTGVGGYSREHGAKSEGPRETAQFQVEDHRSPDEVLASLCAAGYLPSYCTACYRQGRTGDRFMALAKSGQIQNVCQPNAILTFQEYLEDYGSPATRAAGEKAIREHLGSITNPAVRKRTEEGLQEIKKGRRDLYF